MMITQKVVRISSLY